MSFFAEHSVLIIILVLLVSSLFTVLFPKAQWYLSYGWRYRGGQEPSALWLFFTRLGGVIATAVMLIALYCYLQPEDTPEWVSRMLKSVEESK